MSEENLRPQIIETLYKVREDVRKIGLSERDLLILLVDRVRAKDRYGHKRKLTMNQIKSVLDALTTFEKELLRNQKRK